MFFVGSKIKFITFNGLLLFTLLLGACGGGSSSNRSPDNSLQSPSVNNPPPQITQPVILSRTPEVSAKLIDISTEIQLEFDKELDPEKSSIKLSLISNSSALVSGQSAISNNVISFIPTDLLEYSAKYKVDVDYTTTDNATGNLNWTFDTLAKQNVSILSNSISDANNVVSVDSIIQLTFSMPVAATDITIELISVLDNSSIQSNIDIEDSVVFFAPLSNLQPNSEYELKISSTPTSQLYFDNQSINFNTKKVFVDNSSFFPDIRAIGRTKLSLNPTESVLENTDTLVSIGIPFPRGFLTELSDFRITDEQGVEIDIYAKTNLVWQAVGNNDSSIRSVIAQFSQAFSKDENGKLQSKDLYLEWGRDRTFLNDSVVDPTSLWQLVDDDAYKASDAVYEPTVYAVFSSEWYGESVIKTRLLPLSSNKLFSDYDTAFEVFGDTAIDHVDPRVEEQNLQPYRESYASWLFDRAMTLYQLAFRSGEFKYIRAAHRASQFYQNKISDGGYFTLKPFNDLKYSYGESLVSDYILFGDPKIPQIVATIADAWSSFNTQYTVNSNFWTERHAAFQLLSYVTAYEVIGSEVWASKAKSTYQILRQMQISPDEGVPITGALMHTATSHGAGGTDFIASPWMSVLLLDAIERYYIHFRDETVADFAIKMADYFSQESIATYEWGGYQGNEYFFLPRYLAGGNLNSNSPGTDIEHVPDVMKIFYLGYYFSCQIGHCNSDYLSILSKLEFSQSLLFPHWIRAAAPDVGLTSYRLSPPRKFSWWFRTTANNDFLIGPNTELPLYKPSSSELVIIQEYDGPEYFKPNEEFTLRYKVKNTGDSNSKNIVLRAKVAKYSPQGLLEVVDFSEGGVNYGNEVVWTIDTVEPEQEIEAFTLTYKVKDFPVLQTKTRPLGNLIAYAELLYCEDGDDESTCQAWKTAWEPGLHTYRDTSNWHLIRPFPPQSAPVIEILNPIDHDTISGQVVIQTEIHDEEGVARVDIFLNEELLVTKTEPPYSTTFNANALSDNEHKIKVVAWDIFGSEGTKEIMIIPGQPDIVAPIVTINTPEDSVKYCNKAVIDYSVEDDNALSHCMLAIGDAEVLRPNCQPYTFYLPAPLFHSQALVNFDNDNEPVNSIDGHSLVGEPHNVSYVTGRSEKAAYFDGSSSMIEYSKTALDIENEITVSFWFKADRDEGVILSQDWYYIGLEQGWSISLGSNNHEATNTLSITWSSGDYANNSNNANVVQSASNSIVLNQWHHVIIRKDDTLVEIYIDGQLSASKTIANEVIAWPFNSQKQLSIAKPMHHESMYNQYFKGSLDDLSIWNTAISDIELAQLLSGSTALEQHVLKVSAIDNAGNVGHSSVSFSTGQCN